MADEVIKTMARFKVKTKDCQLEVNSTDGTIIKGTDGQLQFDFTDKITFKTIKMMLKVYGSLEHLHLVCFRIIQF